MKYAFKIIFAALMFLSIAGLFSYSGAMDIAELVDQFKQATDLKREQIRNDYFGKEMPAGGTVSNVEEYNFFDERKDLTANFFKVTTEIQKTDSGTAYQIVFLYKDLDSVKDINKGQKLAKEGKIIKIIDERLQITVWLFGQDLTAKERELFY